MGNAYLEQEYFMITLFAKLRSRILRILEGRGILISRVKPRMPWPGYSTRYFYQKEYNQFDVQSDAIVLDIGSGGDPFPFATFLTDRFIEPTRHRTAQLKRNNKPFFISAIEQLPFADKSIDFIFCSHVLEHVDNPVVACSEIVRTAKRGYIETPTLAKDMLFGWAKGMHKWHLLAISNKLLFFEYSERELEGARSNAWSQLIFSRYYHPLQDLFFKNQDIFNVMFNWENGFECFVFYLDGRIDQKMIF